VRGPEDRRRQVLRRTAEGRRLLSDCVAAAQALDVELTSELGDAQRTALTRGLRLLGEQHLSAWTYGVIGCAAWVLGECSTG
jgi:DNA-binding MarR family transcriptional regulator